MGRGRNTHRFGNQIVSGAGNQTVVSAKVDGGIYTQVLAHKHGLQKGLCIRNVHTAVVAGSQNDDMWL